MTTHAHKFLMFLLALAIFSVLQLYGLTMEQSFVFDSSGGMKVSYAYEVPNQWVGILAAIQQEVTTRAGLPSSGGALDEGAVRRQFSGLRGGVYVENYSLFQLGDAQRVEFTVVALEAAPALESGAFGAVRYRGPTAEDQGGEFELQMPPEEKREAMNEEHARRIAEMLGGFECTLKVTAPAPVHAEGTTGEAETDMRRVWHMTLTDLLSRQLPVIRISW